MGAKRIYARRKNSGARRIKEARGLVQGGSKEDLCQEELRRSNARRN